MKEYKMIQWYPTLPTEWYKEKNIVVVKRDNVYMLHPSLKDQTKEVTGLTEREVEKNKKFWKELKPKKRFQILSFKYRDSVSLIKYNPRTKKFDAAFSYTEEEMFTWAYTKIHSVQDIETGNIFTLKDRIGYHTLKYNEVGTITDFYINDQGECIAHHYVGDDLVFSGNIKHLRVLKPETKDTTEQLKIPENKDFKKELKVALESGFNVFYPPNGRGEYFCVYTAIDNVIKLIKKYENK